VFLPRWGGLPNVVGDSQTGGVLVSVGFIYWETVRSESGFFCNLRNGSTLWWKLRWKSLRNGGEDFTKDVRRRISEVHTKIYTML